MPGDRTSTCWVTEHAAPLGPEAAHQDQTLLQQLDLLLAVEGQGPFRSPDLLWRVTTEPWLTSVWPGRMPVAVIREVLS